MSRLEFFQSLQKDFDQYELKRIQKAYWFSKNIHRPQVRDSGERYFEHPLRVAKMLKEVCQPNDELIRTALLHDVLEDTWTPHEVFIDIFGQTVFKNVQLLSKKLRVLDPLTMEEVVKISIEPEMYYKRISDASWVVRMVKVADRVDNTTDIKDFSEEKRQRYIEETTKWIYPIAESSSPILFKMLKENIES